MMMLELAHIMQLSGFISWLNLIYLFIYVFIHHTACSQQAMAGEVQTNNPEQE
jgi:hypothetical protein